VLEAEEPFAKGQKGSSAMPHKRNPILSERICGMARTVRANSIVGLEDVALWHERDISHSSAERIVLPDSSATLDYMLAKTTSMLDALVVYPENMLKNLNLTRGLVFSGQLMLALTQKGVSREDAYVYTQRNAMKVWDEGGDYKELVIKDAEISSHLSTEQIARVFDLNHYLRNVDKVFSRVFEN
jgi:adenylosuccinate lyase